MENEDKKKVAVYDPPQRQAKLLITLPPVRFKSDMFPRTFKELQERLKAGEKFIVFDNMSEHLGNEWKW